jgi:D-amino peptidase
MRVYVSVDIEGIAGVTSRRHSTIDGPDYGLARQWMTGTAVAAAESALAAGATEVVVADGHGKGENIDIGQLPAGCSLVRGSPRPLGMMQGIDVGHYDAAFLLGYHAGVSAMSGVLAHTYNGKALREVRINGQVANEAMLNAALAGECGVPVAVVSGDDVFAEEVATFLPDTTRVVVQQSHGVYSATAMRPSAAEAAIREAVSKALGRLDQIAPFRMTPPIVVELDFKHRMVAEIMAYAPWFERYAPFSIRFTAPTMRAAYSIFMFVLRHNVALQD